MLSKMCGSNVGGLLLNDENGACEFPSHVESASAQDASPCRQYTSNFKHVITENTRLKANTQCNQYFSDYYKFQQAICPRE